MNKNFSVAKTILATLWHLKKADPDIILDHQYARSFCWEKSRNTYRSSISRLKSKGLIIKDDFNNISLTSLGKKEALKAFIGAELRLYNCDKQDWDGGWRIIIFDIPENKRRHRDYLRGVLKTIGFKEFQKSIWINPYPIPPFLKELLFDNNIKMYARLITTDSIEDDADLKTFFKL